MLMFKGRRVRSLEVDGVNSRDYPDFCDDYFSYAEYENGTPLTDDELYDLSIEHGDVVNEMAYDKCHDAAEYLCDMDR